MHVSMIEELIANEADPVVLDLAEVTLADREVVRFLVACDVSDEFTRIGRPFWREAGVESKIDLRLKPALQSLDGEQITTVAEEINRFLA